MRVISGKYKGKKLEGFNLEGTRPTMDRVKESLFASIQSKIEGSDVLDLFAGSGALGIEAISEGAKSCYFVDNNSLAIDMIKKNLKFVNEEVYIIKDDYLNALSTLKNNKFDIIFLDPPYKMNIINNCIDKIYKYGMLKEDGIIVCEYETEDIKEEYFDLSKVKKYGCKYVKILKNKNN